jgi:hypothetical protein
MRSGAMSATTRLPPGLWAAPLGIRACLRAVVRQELTGCSAGVDRRDIATTCSHSEQHRGPTNPHARGEDWTRYSLPLESHSGYQIDH